MRCVIQTSGWLAGRLGVEPRRRRRRRPLLHRSQRARGGAESSEGRARAREWALPAPALAFWVSDLIRAPGRRLACRRRWVVESVDSLKALQKGQRVVIQPSLVLFSIHILALFPPPTSLHTFHSSFGLVHHTLFSPTQSLLPPSTSLAHHDCYQDPPAPRCSRLGRRR